MDLGANQKIRLLPSDEYNHPIEEAINFNESMYINLFDHQQKIGGLVSRWQSPQRKIR